MQKNLEKYMRNFETPEGTNIIIRKKYLTDIK